MPQEPTKGQLLIVTCVALVFLTSTAPRRAHGMSMTVEQNPQTADATTRMAVDRFNEAFNRHDTDALAPVPGSVALKRMFARDPVSAL